MGAANNGPVTLHPKCWLAVDQALFYSFYCFEAYTMPNDKPINN